MLCLTAQLRRTYWCKHSVPPVQWGMLVAAKNTGCSEHGLLELEVLGLISNNCHFLFIHSLLNIKHAPTFPAETRCSNYRVEENWNELSRPQVFAPMCPVVGKVKVQRLTYTLRPCWFRTSHAFTRVPATPVQWFANIILRTLDMHSCFGPGTQWQW